MVDEKDIILPDSGVIDEPSKLPTPPESPKKPKADPLPIAKESDNAGKDSAPVPSNAPTVVASDTGSVK